MWENGSIHCKEYISYAEILVTGIFSISHIWSWSDDFPCWKHNSESYKGLTNYGGYQHCSPTISGSPQGHIVKLYFYASLMLDMIDLFVCLYTSAVLSAFTVASVLVWNQVANVL